MFDILDRYWNWENQNIIQFDFNLKPTVLSQLNNVGYGNHNSFLSLSTLGFAVILYFLRLLLAAFAKALKLTFKGKFGTKKLYYFLKKGIIFNFIL